jgi:pentatricopeptide repeat protein
VGSNEALVAVKEDVMPCCSFASKLLAALGLCGALAGCQANGVGLRERMGIARAQPKQAAHGTFQAEQALAGKMQAARAAERKGDLPSAIATYAAIVQQHPCCAEAYHGLAVCHCKQGNLDQAERYYQDAMRHAPVYPDMLCDFAYCQYLRGDLAQAESLLRRALEQDPGMPRAYANLGLVLARSGRQQESLCAFAQAGCPKADAHVNLAYALMWDEQLDQAETQFKSALHVEPSSPAAAEGLAQLRVRRNAAGPKEGEAGTIARK